MPVFFVGKIGLILIGFKCILKAVSFNIHFSPLALSKVVILDVTH